MDDESGPHSNQYSSLPRTPSRRSDGSNMGSWGNSPYNRGGTASHHEETQHTHKEIDPYLRYDIEDDKADVDLELFMQNILSSPSSPDDADSKAIEQIANSKTFTQLLEDYKEPTTKEEDLYPRFASLCREAISQMEEKKITKNELGFILCVHDPQYVCGSEGLRKPDMVGTGVKAIKARIRNAEEREEGEEGGGGGETKTKGKEKARTNGKEKTKTNGKEKPKTNGKEKPKTNGKEKAKTNGKEKAVKPLCTADSSGVAPERITEYMKQKPGISLTWSDLFTFVEFKGYLVAAEAGPAPQVPPSDPTLVAGPSKRSNNEASRSRVTQATNSQVSSRGGQASHVSSYSGNSANRSLLSGSGAGPSNASRTSSKRARDDDDCTGDLGSTQKKSRVTATRSPTIKGKIPIGDREQCAGYSHSLFNRGGIRTHVIVSFFSYTRLQLLLYTRSRGCSTTAFDFIKDPRLFLRILLAFTRLDLSQWGFCEKLIPRTLSTPRILDGTGRRDRHMFEGEVLTLNGRKYEALAIRLFPRGLIGRGTWTLAIREGSGRDPEKTNGQTLILKISSPASTRRTEEFFIKEAQGKAAAEHSWVLDHLPNMFDSGELHSGGDRDSLFQELLGHDYEKRTLRYLVVEQLFPITALTKPEDLILSFKDIIKCHQWLVTVAGILHRDISVNNLMYRQKNGEKFGVLNDYDLASTMEEDRQATSKQRTGTKPFIALDLLESDDQADARHFVRYDLESTVYVFAWIICRYENGHEIENPPLEEWCYGSWEDVSKKKYFWIHRGWAPPTPQYAPLIPVLLALTEVLEQGLAEQTRHRKLLLANANTPPFRADTLNDKITYTTILDAFDQPPIYTEFPEPAVS